MATTVKVSRKVADIIDKLVNNNELSDSVRREIEQQKKLRDENQNGLIIPFDLLKAIHKFMDGKNGKKIYFHEFVEECEIFLQPLKEPERNPELVARLEKLRNQQEQKLYQEMTKNVSHEVFGESAIAQLRQELRPLKKQLMGILNFILTIFGSFTFGYMAAYYSGQSQVFRVFLGLFLALITAAADLYFFIKHEV